MADVFISYKSEDRSSAELIARALEVEGFTVWWDPDLQSGQDYQEVIDTNLRTALAVVVLWSPLSVKSRWVRSEATVGDRQGALLPVMVAACDRPVAFELVQTTDLTLWRGNRDAPEWRRFIDAVRATLTKRRAQAASASPPAPMAASDLEGLFWSSIRDSADRSDFESYLSRYPNGHFSDLARTRLKVGKGPTKALIARHKALIALGAAVVVIGAALALSQGILKRTPTVPNAPPTAPTGTPIAASDKVIEIWFGGSPHQSELPSAALSSTILDTARALGYKVNSRGLYATDFMPELLKALASGNPPDVVFVDNYLHVIGGTTALGTFTGMQSDARLRPQLVRVNEALGDLGRGWTFLLGASPDHAGADTLVAELSGCPTPLGALGEESLRTLQLQAESAARGFLQCVADPALYDRAALTRDCAKQQTHLRRVSVCRITAAAKLALVETAAAIAGEHEVGRRSIVSVHRFDDGWRVLVVSGDAVSTGTTAGQWRALAPRFTRSRTAPAQASLQTPDGVLPSPPAGQRFGDFTWLPAQGPAIGQFVELNYANDTRLFLVGPAEGRLSTGKLITTNGAWRWRVWTVGSDGAVVLSETRSFQH
ncbi:MAG TPA: toll/interleukin-1 receptor domain-containing protein [Candidatus Acidoferrum sp.]|nr:toll/interleukin-1 receptor domain-containing protein [Candidatus Acidoferrum sp.]